jgi:hypothetical protein
MKKARLSVYLDPEMMAQLIELADQKQKPKSLIAEAAILSFLTPDDADRREAALARRLDLLTRQGERLERDLWVAAETLALFIRFWLTVTTPLPEGSFTLGSWIAPIGGPETRAPLWSFQNSRLPLKRRTCSAFKSTMIAST